ncbi:MAG: TolC family protein [Desulfobulbaceae bacterium]|nr:TolC family protein [Desulfobulbaceae bacterium]
MKYFFIISWLPITLNHEVGGMSMRMKYVVLCMVMLISGLTSWLALPAVAAERAPTVQKAETFSLEQAIDRVLANNPLISAALEKKHQAEAGECCARADLLPKFSTSYSYYRLHDQPYGFFGPAGKIMIGDKDDYKWDITAVQPLFTGLALTTRRKIAELEISGRELEKEQLILELVKKTKVAYARILLARRQLEVAAKEAENLAAHVKDAEYLYDQGVIAYNDLLQSRVALSQAVQHRVQAESGLDLAAAALNMLMNRDISAAIEVIELDIQPAVNENLSALWAQAMDQRPVLRFLQVAFKQAELAITLARSRYYPQVSLVGRYEQNGKNITAGKNDYRNSDTAAIGLQADWTFFEWGKTGAEVRQRLHEREALKHRIENMKNTVRLEVKMAFNRLRVADKNVKTAVAAVEQAWENYRITNLQYQQQVATSTLVLDAATFLSQAENSYYGALYGFMISRAELEQAAGERANIGIKGMADSEKEAGNG